MPTWLIIVYLFLLGACVGSFLNVVVYRLPRITVDAGTSLGRELWLTLRGLSSPPSHCPRCNTRLSWRDNIPVLGWILLRGKCRYCGQPISARYPIIEFITGTLFAGTFVLMYLFDLGPCAPGVAAVNQYGVDVTRPGGLTLSRDGWLLAIYLPMIACLLAASLIDAELFIIPLWIPWLLALIGFTGHAIHTPASSPGGLVQPPATGLMAIGAGLGLILSLLLLRYGGVRRSFLEGEQLLKQEQDAIMAGTLDPNDIAVQTKDYTPAEVRREIRHEMVFLIPPLLLAGLFGYLAMKWPPMAELGERVARTPHLNGFVGSLFGAMIGAAWVWLTRILGSAGFGREAMGMGDVHLMFGVGAIVGAGMSTVAFFLAPLPGLLIHLYLLFVDPKRAVPYGPYLSFASVSVIFVYCPISVWLAGGMEGLAIVIRSLLGV